MAPLAPRVAAAQRFTPSRRWRRAGAALALLLALASFPSLALAAQYSWPQFDLNAQHNGDNTLETAITPASVSGLRPIFRVSLPAIADGAPAILNAVSTPQGVKDVAFVTTKAGDIVALDAHTGAQYWVRHHPAGSCTINNGGTPCYTTSSPAIDPNRQYVYSYGLDGYVHKYKVGDGSEISGNGWPELVTRKPFDEKASPALAIATAKSGASYLYAANGGYPGDRGDYQGHITAINLSTGAQNVFNALCSNQTVHFYEKPATPDCGHVQAAIWARPGVVYDPDTDRIFMATGNGAFAPSSDDWGDTVFKLNPDGTGASGKPLDSYTPTNYSYLQQNDLDLGSTAPAIVPAPAGSAYKHLAVQSGKDGELRLLNLDNLSGQGGPGHTGGQLQIRPVPQGNEVLTQPASWVNPADGGSWVFVANDNGISGLRLSVSGGRPGMQFMWTDPTGGSSPIVANGVLFYAGNHSIQALDPTTGRWLWHDTSIGNIHWESPVVANGTLYVTDESGTLTAYGLLSGNHSAAIAAQGGSSTYTFVPGAGGTVAVGSCAVNTGDRVAVYVYNSGGALVSSAAASSYCNWASAPVNAGLTYTVKTVATVGSSLVYRSAWSVNGAAVLWNVNGVIDVSGGSSTVSVPVLRAGSIAISTCGPSGTNFNLYLTNAQGHALATSSTSSTCESLSYNAGARGLYRIKEVSASGTGTWTGTLTSG